MRIDVHTVSQTAHDEHFRTKFFQFCKKLSYHILAVSRAMTCANNIDNARPIQVGVTFKEQHEWGISAVF